MTALCHLPDTRQTQFKKVNLFAYVFLWVEPKTYDATDDSESFPAEWEKRTCEILEYWSSRKLFWFSGEKRYWNVEFQKMRGDCVFQSWFGTGLLTRVDLSAPPQFLLIAQTVRQGRKKSRAPGDLILSLSDMRNLDHPSERKCILCIFLTIKLFM